MSRTFLEKHSFDHQENQRTAREQNRTDFPMKNINNRLHTISETNPQQNTNRANSFQILTRNLHNINQTSHEKSGIKRHEDLIKRRNNNFPNSHNRHQKAS
jgi:hypothetical protein